MKMKNSKNLMMNMMMEIIIRTLILMMMKMIITWRMTMLMRLYISCLAENSHVSLSDKHFASSVNWTIFAMVVVKCTWEFSGFKNMQQGATFWSFPFCNIDYHAIFS